jgi:hypothetical protein
MRAFTRGVTTSIVIAAIVIFDLASGASLGYSLLVMAVVVAVVGVGIRKAGTR